MGQTHALFQPTLLQRHKKGLVQDATNPKERFRKTSKSKKLTAPKLEIINEKNKCF